MKRRTTRAKRRVLIGAYIYLALPMIIFLLGWCRWYIGIPVAVVVILAVVLCVDEIGTVPRTRRERRLIDSGNRSKALAVVLIVCIWAALSGVGGYVWQNSDHWWRNAIFESLVEQKWAPSVEMEIDGYVQGRGMVYYIGFWLPAALVGKLFGVEAGYAAQYVWAVIGILLFYAVLCVYRRKVQIWPIVVFIFFSGLDAVGVLLSQSDGLQIFGEQHLEAWSYHYQFSSVTTQLFWVFNQAVPIWLASALIFFGERPRNMIFVWTLTMLTSTLPCIGLLPYVAYFMVKRSNWRAPYETTRELVQDIWYNWCSPQNLAGGGVVAIVSAIYLFGNTTLLNVLSFLLEKMSAGVLVLLFFLAVVLFAVIFCVVAWLVRKGWGKRLKTAVCLAGVAAVVWKISRLAYSDWQSPVFFWVNMTVFVFLEAGVYLICLSPVVEDKGLLKFTAVWLYIVPLIVIGTSCDFCMRASIPGLLLITLWCIDMIDRHKGELRTYVLIALLIVGAVTPLHEIRRTYINTHSYYENTSVGEEVIYSSDNFSGSTDGFFWKYIARNHDE